MSTSWFVWLWAVIVVAVLVVLVVVVVTGFAVLRLVRGQWTRLVSQSNNQAAAAPAPAPRRSGGSRPGVRSCSADTGHEYA